MKIIFCCDPASHANPDSMFIDEVAAATHAGLKFLLMDYEALTEQNNAARAVRDIPVQKTLETAVYRGWSLTLAQYAALYDALRSRGIRLMNNVYQFKHAQYLPLWYDHVKDKTPQSVWMETDGKKLSYDAIMQLLILFGEQPLILRDYAQTEKHYWNQACYIPAASDRYTVQSIVDGFLKLRGKKLEGGLVFREYVDFELLVESSPNAGMPLVKEYRIFYLDGKPLSMIHYWQSDEDSADDEPDLDAFNLLAQQIRSRFFTIDIAKRSNGDWFIIDLGDAQIANLPITSDLDTVYRALASTS